MSRMQPEPNDNTGPLGLAAGRLPLIESVIGALKTIQDPEIPINIYDLGLIYRIDAYADGAVEIDMTLTAPGCPVAADIMRWVEEAVRQIDGVESLTIKLVFDPPWEQSKMSEEAMLELGLL